MATEYLYGRHAVLESLRAARRQHIGVHLGDYVQADQRLEEIQDLARQQSIAVRSVSRNDIERQTQFGNQGVLLETSGYPYATDNISSPQSDDLLLALDELEDPRNAGALFRTAEAVGVRGVVFPERRSVEVTPAVVNASSGAVEHIDVWREKNLARWLSSVSELGYWIVGLDGGEDSLNLFDADLPMPAVVVVGSEGRGLRRLTRERCDMLVRIPMYGKIESLNAAAAGSIALYHLREYGI
ncbi:23S rRNA (guanosine(2251)-2'-O)-methyltransferase RlmB [soil metagenome]